MFIWLGQNSSVFIKDEVFFYSRSLKRSLLKKKKKLEKKKWKVKEINNSLRISKSIR